MSLARVHTWATLEDLYASHLNGEFDNILNNPTSLLSPLTAGIAAATSKVTNLAAATTAGDMLRFDDIPALATQAQQETGTSNVVAVTPGRQQFHKSACKAWCYTDFNGTNQASYNVASIVDGGAGHEIVTFTTALSAAGAYISCCDNNGTPLALQCLTTAALAELYAKNTAGSLTDAQSYFVACFGDFA